MREVITVQIGGAGLRLGNEFWRLAAAEHGLDEMGIFHGSSDLQLNGIGVYFNEVAGGRRFVARTLLADTDATFVQSSLSECCLLPRDCATVGREHSANVFSRTFLPDRQGDLVDSLTDSLRRLAEAAACPQSVQVVHAIGGGTGSGLTCRLLPAVRDISDKLLNVAWTVVPSPAVSDKVIEPYNAILSVKHLRQFADLAFVLDNEALSRIATEKLAAGSPQLQLLNSLASMAMVNTTASFRFPGQQNADWRHLFVNAVPRCGLHFVTTSLAPLPATSQHTDSASVQSVVSALFHPSSFFTSGGSGGKYLTCHAVFRGRVRMSEIDRAIAAANRSQPMRHRSIPDAISRAVCDIPPAGCRLSAVMTANHTAVADTVDRELSKFKTMLGRRAFLHWYDGFELHEFESAAEAAQQLIDDYRSAAGCGAADDASEEW